MMTLGLGGVAATALAAVLATPAYAQTEPQEAEVAEVVVTGSYIRGTPEDAGSPVDVIGREQLQSVGTPTLIELTRVLGASQGINSESNQYGSNNLEGVANINLRGLGPGRTLVLINGQRQAPAGVSILEFGSQQFVDLNSIPLPAIGRVEVLKDGAAATYGSDAVAGVVNLITRRDFEGFEVTGSYQLMNGGALSETFSDYNASATYGWQGDKSSWVTTAAYVKREDIQFRDVEWALRPFSESFVTPALAAGLFSGITNPGSYTPIATPYGPGVTPGYGSITTYPTTPPTPGGAPVVDPGCGSYVGGPNGEWGPLLVNGACRFNSVAFARLVDPEQRYQLFSEFNHEFDGSMAFHVEGMYSKTDSSYQTSPSFPPPLQSLQYVPAANPGLQDLIATNPAVYGPLFANGAIFNGRAIGPSGRYDGSCCVTGNRDHETLRFAGALTGTFNETFIGDVDFTFNLAFSKSESEVRTDDILTNNFRLGLLGLGGPQCDPVSGTPGVGNCYWVSPYSSFQQQHILGESTVNPNFQPQANVNAALLDDWLYGDTGADFTNELTVAEAIFSGELPFSLSGGPVGYAVGAQARSERYEVDPTDLSDLSRNPCTVQGDLTCGTSAGVFQFVQGYTPRVLSREVYALFGELSLPFTDTLEAQLAARYERFPGETGSTFDPKVQIRWQAHPVLALRASAQTAFRAPTLNQLEDVSTAQTPLVGLTFIPFDTRGNPNLIPETSFSFNVGAILDIDSIAESNVGLNASIDYFNFKLEDPIQREGAATIAGPVLAAGCAPGTPFYDRLSFNPGTNSGCVNVVRVGVNLINGPEVKTDGIDVAVTLDVDEVFGGNLAFTVEGTYILTYDIAAFSGPGYNLPSSDPLGFLNKNTAYRPLPQYKVNGGVRYNNGPHALAVTARYTTSYEDQRFNDTTQAAFRDIESFTTVDATYNVDLPWDVTASVSVFNLFDKEPPSVYQENFYDPYTASPFGRIFKFGLVKLF